MQWEAVHDKHAEKLGDNCTSCHSSEPTGFIQPFGGLCSDCHSGSKAEKFFEGEMSAQKLHKKHLVDENDTSITCDRCHTF